MEKSKKKTETKIANLHGRIDELEQNNKEMKEKIAEFRSTAMNSLN